MLLPDLLLVRLSLPEASGCHTPEIGAGPVNRARAFDDGWFWVQRVILSFVAPMFPPTLGVGLVDEFILQQFQDLIAITTLKLAL